MNVLDLILDKSRDLVVTERPLGYSIAELLKGSSFDLEDVVRLMPLTALDFATTLCVRPNSISARLLFVETTRPQDEQIDLKRRPIFDWPPIVIKLDVLELVRPSKNLTWPFLNSKEQASGSTGWAVRQAAQLTYELLGAEKRKGCDIKRRFKPLNALGNAGNSILNDGLKRSSLFESSEAFFTNWSQRFDPATESRVHYLYLRRTPGNISAASSRTNDVIRRSNRDTGLIATGVLGAVVFAALLLAVLVQERQPKADDLTEKARQAERDLLPNANPATRFTVVSLNEKSSTGKISSEQASSVGHAFTEISPKEIPSSQIEPAASTPTPVLAFTPEINRHDVQANTSSWSPGHWQDSARVKMRLIALWHQSLARSEKSRSWKKFSNLKRGVRKKPAYTAETIGPRNQKEP